MKYRNLSLQLEVISLNFNDFMVHDEKYSLHRMVCYLNNITPHLVAGFHTESNMIRYHFNAVLSKK